MKHRLIITARALQFTQHPGPSWRRAFIRLGERMAATQPDEQDVIGLLRDYTARRERTSAAIPQADGAP